MVKRIYVEKQKQFDSVANNLRTNIKQLLNIDLDYVRRIIRYDIDGIDESIFEKAKNSVFSDPTVDVTFDSLDEFSDKQILAMEFLDGQFDQLADSASQGLQLLSQGERPIVKCATVYIFERLSDERISDDEFSKIKNYLINPVDSKEASMQLTDTLKRAEAKPQQMRVEMNGFINLEKKELKEFCDEFGIAMSFEDISFVHDYFKSEKRNPTYTELKVLDTYWSDHCRHSTFLTEIKSIKVESDITHIQKSLDCYRKTFDELYKTRPEKYPCLMDIATIAVKQLKKEGYLKNLDESEEINACSVVVEVDNGKKIEEWLIMFKNETHNHPTEIEPYGGAGTCLGGAIRDPLSGRVYVYQSMRITGGGNPLEKLEDTMDGKLPQRVLAQTALAGFSSYGNRIGLAAGLARDLYHDRFRAKRMEAGYVIGGALKEHIVRERPQDGDIILLVGGETGRDGCGGATGSSKSQTQESATLCGAEVQKGNASEEHYIQRLFRNPDASKLIIRCNDFGAGGVSVAIGELADSLDIHLDRVRTKYDGMTATELAISESQERMAVVIKPQNVQKFLSLCQAENLKAEELATVTQSGRMRMFYGDEIIVDLKRDFLNTNGVRQIQDVAIDEKFVDYFNTIDKETKDLLDREKFEDALCYELAKLQNCSQKGTGEYFDSTVGTQAVLMPLGGKTQLTPSTIMASKPPVSDFTHTVTCSSYGICTDLLIKSPYIGAIYSIVAATSKLVASGAGYNTIYLTLQEFFKRLGRDEKRWGEPLSALLGAFDAQYNLKLGAIGGKDSMSGTFEDIDVPPTLIAFGMGTTTDDNIVHNAFFENGFIYRFAIEKDEFGKPNYEKLLAMFDEVETLIKSRKVVNSAVEEGGFLVTLAKSCIGNQVGAKLESINQEMYNYSYGDIILVTKEKIQSKFAKYLGELNSSGKITADGVELDIKTLTKAFTSTLETVFPTFSQAKGSAENVSYNATKVFKGKTIAKPRVLVPVFPATNGEYDLAKAFEMAGAIVDTFVVKNKSTNDIEQSVAELKKAIDNAQILALPAGFSSGDEPDSSGNFVANLLRKPVLAESIENLLYNRDGLAVGIANGFQALLKLGLLPFGRIQAQTNKDATLTLNNIGRHVSKATKVRLASNNSAWLNGFNIGDIFSVPVSCDEGRFVCSDETLKILKANGQIATQYADNSGNATMQNPFNPSGSLCAIEGILSPCGRVLGKVGHTERYSSCLYQNIEGNFEMNIFANGVKYFE